MEIAADRRRAEPRRRAGTQSGIGVDIGQIDHQIVTCLGMERTADRHRGDRRVAAADQRGVDAHIRRPEHQVATGSCCQRTRHVERVHTYVIVAGEVGILANAQLRRDQVATGGHVQPMSHRQTTERGGRLRGEPCASLDIPGHDGNVRCPDRSIAADPQPIDAEVRPGNRGKTASDHRGAQTGR